MSKVEIAGKQGFIDKVGRVVVPARFDEVEAFSNGVAMVEFNGKRGLIDKNGNEIVPVKYDLVMAYYSGLIEASISKKYGFLDRMGKEFNNGLARSRIGDEKTGKWGYIDENGREVIETKYNGFWAEWHSGGRIYRRCPKRKKGGCRHLWKRMF